LGQRFRQHLRSAGPKARNYLAQVVSEARLRAEE
jgi:hypothetical protein